MIRFGRAAGVVAGLALLTWPAIAQSEAPSAPSTHQVQAFRDHDAEGALAEAAKPFHDMFPDPAAFFSAIMTGGYQPIMDSQSDTFGEYQMVAPDTVLQRVSFVGKDQTLYDAIYEMGHEDAGWRVEAVQMTKAAGTGV